MWSHQPQHTLPVPLRHLDRAATWLEIVCLLGHGLVVGKSTFWRQNFSPSTLSGSEGPESQMRRGHTEMQCELGSHSLVLPPKVEFDNTDDGRVQQCVRLGHPCDYSPRLSFKDETLKYVHKYEGKDAANRENWDPSVAHQASEDGQQYRHSSDDDSLPSFTSMGNDEEWEDKAARHRPGRFYVVLNASSFAEQQPNEDDPGEGSSRTQVTAGRQKRARSCHRQRRDSTESSKMGGLGFEEDRNVKIVRNFDEISRPSTQSSSRTVPPSPTVSLISCTEGMGTLTVTTASHPQSPSVGEEQQQRYEESLMTHYRQSVRRHVMLPNNGFAGSTRPEAVATWDDPFEHEASLSAPLRHAILALAALSLADQQRGLTAEAYRHYDQAIRLSSNIRSSEDLASNSSFIMHFLLLIYDIAAAEPGGSSFWSQHMSRVLQIAPIRRQQFEREPFPFILWRVGMIDICALLSNLSNGAFVEAMLTEDLLPNVDHEIFAADLNSQAQSTRQLQALNTNTLALHRTTMLLAAELGLLAREMRSTHSPLVGTAERMHRQGLRAETGIYQQRLAALRERFRQCWNTPFVAQMQRNGSPRLSSVSSTVTTIFEHSTALYHMCMIYSYTNMHATQLSESPSSIPNNAVMQGVDAILRLASTAMHREQMISQFLVFPTFIAGVAASTSPERRDLALHIIGQMEMESIGNNTKATRRLLEAVYEEQDASLARGVPAGQVDWITVMEDRSMQVVNFGL
ncbi:hypothetical protein MMC25_002803 [Agyrium rufum]|nr:hypothetical protein [Agyrium rufum]